MHRMTQCLRHAECFPFSSTAGVSIEKSARRLLQRIVLFQSQASERLHSSLPKGHIMRNKYILHGAGLTLAGTLCLSICAAAAQTQSASFSKLIPYITSDAVGFDSGLWRSEYLRQPRQDNDEAAAAISAVTTKETNSGSVKSPPPVFVYSDKLVRIPLDTPALIEPHMFDADGESALQEETAISEWENAVAESGAGLIPGSTASGPSVTSAIVSFVGIMIVIGAHISSGKRNR